MLSALHHYSSSINTWSVQHSLAMAMPKFNVKVCEYVFYGQSGSRFTARSTRAWIPCRRLLPRVVSCEWVRPAPSRPCYRYAVVTTCCVAAVSLFVSSEPHAPCVQVISDNVCPWCFVGKRNLENAMKQFAASRPNDSQPPAFDVRWKPFFLNVKSPETSEEPIQVRPRVEGSLRRGHDNLTDRLAFPPYYNQLRYSSRSVVSSSYSWSYHTWYLPCRGFSLYSQRQG